MSAVDPLGGRALPPPRARRRIFPAFPITVIALTCVLGLRLLLLPGVADKLLAALATHSSPGVESCLRLSLDKEGGPEGSCVRRGRDGELTRFVVVNQTHRLLMPEYTAVVGAAYVIQANRVGQLVSYRLSVTNTTDSPLDFGVTEPEPPGPHYSRDQVVELRLPQQTGPYPELGYAPLLGDIDAQRPDTLSVIPPHATASGWVTFLVPDKALAQLSEPGARIDFSRLAAGAPAYLGQVRI